MSKIIEDWNKYIRIGDAWICKTKISAISMNEETGVMSFILATGYPEAMHETGYTPEEIAKVFSILNLEKKNPES